MVEIAAVAARRAARARAGRRGRDPALPPVRSPGRGSAARRPRRRRVGDRRRRPVRRRVRLSGGSTPIRRGGSADRRPRSLASAAGSSGRTPCAAGGRRSSASCAPADLYHACGSLTVAAALAGSRPRPAGRAPLGRVVYDVIDVILESNNVLDMPGAVLRLARPPRDGAGRGRPTPSSPSTSRSPNGSRSAGAWPSRRSRCPNYPELAAGRRRSPAT